jgi:hypothetical protein
MSSQKDQLIDVMLVELDPAFGSLDRANLPRNPFTCA